MISIRPRGTRGVAMLFAGALLASLVCALILVNGAFAAPQESVSRADAIRYASDALFNQGFYEREFINGLDASARQESVGTKVFWVVDFAHADGATTDRVVLTASGTPVTDRATLVKLEAWDSYLARAGVVSDWGWGTAGLVAGALAAFGAYRWLRKPRMGASAWFANTMLGVLVSAYVIGLLMSIDIGDFRGMFVCAGALAMIAGGASYGVKRRGRYALVELPSGESAGEKVASSASADQITDSAPSSAPGRVAAGPGGRSSGSKGGTDLKVTPPEKLPNFSDVGGMDEVKRQLSETVGLLVSHGDLVKRYRIDWNGVLLYGPPGVGKTFLAKAVAGEFGLNFIDVRVSDIISGFAGESSKQVAEVFAKAAKHRPCILFFDEFDSIAQRRDDSSWDTESTRVVNQLLRELESAREVPDLIVMAATNNKSTLDEAAIRPGRFDRHISIPLPDDAARRCIFEAQLSGRPVVGDVRIDELVKRTEGMSAADIATIVNGAALDAMRKSIAGGRIQQGAEQPISPEGLVGAIEDLRAKVRPTVTHASWDDLVLSPDTRKKLQDLQRQIESSEELALRGVEVPRGILLFGPPGTGKTTIARVLASQAKASFFAVDASEIVSMWLGETEKRISRLFDEARRHRPAIIFIDEIDSLVSARDGSDSTGDDVTSQFLREIDGVTGSPGVFVIGATNIPDRLDPALLRGGRLSRQILIPAPDAAGREALFEVHARRMQLADDVDFAALATRAEGMTGADIKEICNAAGLLAFERGSADIAMVDYSAAIKSYRADRRPFVVPDWMAKSWDAASGKDKPPLGFAPSPKPKSPFEE